MKTTITNRLLLLAFLSTLFFSCQEIGSDHTDPPKEIISVEQAREMYNAYSERRVPIIQQYEDSIVSDTSPFTPTRYAEYDLETLKRYVAYIEYEAKRANVDIKTLRFYLANYPNIDKFKNGETVKYPRRNSFFVLPTMAYEGKNVGFSIEDIDGTPTAVPINKGIAREEKQEGGSADTTGQVNEAGFFMSNGAVIMGGSTSLILNDTHISPPPFGPNDFGDN